MGSTGESTLLDWDWCLLWTEDLPGTFLNKWDRLCFSKRSKQYSSHTHASWTLLHPIKSLSVFSPFGPGQPRNCSDRQSTTEVMLYVVWYSFRLALLFCDTYSSVTQTSFMRKPKQQEGTIWRNFQATTPANVFGWTFVIQFLPPALRLQQTWDILEQRQSLPIMSCLNS